MGLYDILVVYDVRCPKCQRIIKETDIQFKPYPYLEVFRLGEIKEAIGTLECPHCKTLFDLKVSLRIVGYGKMTEWIPPDLSKLKELDAILKEKET